MFIYAIFPGQSGPSDRLHPGCILTPLRGLSPFRAMVDLIITNGVFMRKSDCCAIICPFRVMMDLIITHGVLYAMCQNSKAEYCQITATMKVSICIYIITLTCKNTVREFTTSWPWKGLSPGGAQEYSPGACVGLKSTLPRVSRFYNSFALKGRQILTIVQQLTAVTQQCSQHPYLYHYAVTSQLARRTKTTLQKSLLKHKNN